jgi:hypothetical protein
MNGKQKLFTIRETLAKLEVEGTRMGIPDTGTIYSAYRAYVVHEDDLINQRTTWSMTAQGIMLAAFGYIYSARLMVMTTVPTMAHSISMNGSDADWSGLASSLEVFRLEQYDHLLAGICILGIVFGVIAFIAILAALLAVREIKRHLASATGEPSESIRRHYPELTGGGSSWAHWLGFIYPIFLPGTVVLFWLIAWMKLL